MLGALRSTLFIALLCILILVSSGADHGATEEDEMDHSLDTAEEDVICDEDEMDLCMDNETAEEDVICDEDEMDLCMDNETAEEEGECDEDGDCECNADGDEDDLCTDDETMDNETTEEEGPVMMTTATTTMTTTLAAMTTTLVETANLATSTSALTMIGCSASVVANASNLIGSSAGVHAPDGSTCSGSLLSGQECQAICHQGALVIGKIHCNNGILMGESSCYPGFAQKVNRTIVSGKLQLQVSGAMTDAKAKAALAAALSIENKTVDTNNIFVSWQLVTTRRLRQGSPARRLEEQYSLSYEVMVLTGGPSADELRRRAADLSSPNSEASQAFVAEMQTGGLTVDPASIVTLSSPGISEKEIALDPYGQIMEATLNPFTTPAPDTQSTSAEEEEEESSMLMYGAIFVGICVLGVVGYFGWKKFQQQDAPKPSEVVHRGPPEQPTYDMEDEDHVEQTRMGPGSGAVAEGPHVKSQTLAMIMSV